MSPGDKLLIQGGPLFDGSRRHDRGAVLIDGTKVQAVFDHPVRMDRVRTIDARGCLIMPGLVDLHSDSLERNIEKRKGVFFDVDFAVLNLDRHLAACGITTFCHAICFADDELGLRSPEEAEKTVHHIKAFSSSSQSLIRHRIHVRYEVGSEQSYHTVIRLIDQGQVDMVSIMDHTPGQGQFKSMASYVRFQAVEYQLPESLVLEKAREKQEKNPRAWEMVRDLAEVVNRAGIPMLSHDDDTREKVELVRSLGIGASEFPVTEAAARKAREHGIQLFMGAPNLLRDQSTNNNLKASDALRGEFCDGLMSDYYPESLLQSGFLGTVYTGCPIKALKTVTSGPGAYLDTPDIPGRLIPGADADLIIVDRNHTWAHVNRTLVRGKTVYRTH